MRTIRIALPLAAALTIGGCGTYVPEIQEFPGNSVQGQKLVSAIVTNIKCEVRDALYDLYRIEKRTFLDKWGVQMTLNLTIIEKGTLNPTVDWMPPSPASAVFTLGTGGTLSSEATRTDKLSSFFTVAELRRLGPCTREERPGGPFLLQSDLKLNEWLIDAVTAGHTGGVNYDVDTLSGPFKEEVLSHEVKFDVVSSGDISPSWKLTRATVNPSGTFFSVSRDRSHDLTITFGPTDISTEPGKKGKAVPSRIAADAALASDIGVSVSNGIRRAFRP
jgi:hypothetical protein